MTNIESVLDKPDALSWTSRWLEILKRASDEGFHPEAPPYGFGDPTTYGIFERAVEKLFRTGAVRHGAECFNFYFPQELDPEFLVIWEGFEKVPWKYLDASALREFLIARCGDGFAFPLNLKWVLCDEGWFDVLLALRASEAAQGSLDAWFPPSSGLLDRVTEIRAAHPEGFVSSGPTSSEAVLDDWDLADWELRRHLALHRAKSKLKVALSIRKTLSIRKSNEAREAVRPFGRSGGDTVLR